MKSNLRNRAVKITSPWFRHQTENFIQYKLYESSYILLKWILKKATPEHPWVKWTFSSPWKESIVFLLFNRMVKEQNWNNSQKRGEALVQLLNTFIQRPKLLKQLSFLWETLVKTALHKGLWVFFVSIFTFKVRAACCVNLSFRKYSSVYLWEVILTQYFYLNLNFCPCSITIWTKTEMCSFCPRCGLRS